MVVRYFMFRLRPYILTVFLVALMLAVRLLLEPFLQGRLPYSFFYIAVILAAWQGGTAQILTAALLGFLAAEWFFVEPRQSLALATAEGWWGAGIYAFVSLAILGLVKSTRAAESQALTKAVEARRVLDELKQSQAIREFLADIVQNARDAILSVTDHGRIATWNPAAEKLLGFSAPEAIGQPLALIVPASYRQQEQLILDKINRGEAIERWDTVLTSKDGSAITVSLTISPVKDSGGKLIGASVVARSKARAADPASC